MALQLLPSGVFVATVAGASFSTQGYERLARDKQMLHDQTLCVHTATTQHGLVLLCCHIKHRRVTHRPPHPGQLK
jgi:hypothetical protein